MPAPGLLRGADRAAFTVAFAERLRAAGVPVGLTAVEAFTRALGVAPVSTRSQLYWVSRSTLLRRHAELELFDAVFAAVFADAAFDLDPHLRRGPRPPLGGTDDAWARSAAVDAPDQTGTGLPWLTLPAVVDTAEEPGGGQPVPLRLPSALEALADAPFAELDERQLAAVGAFLEATLPRWPVRRGRRRRRHSAGDRIALRATLQRARRTGWEPVELVRTRAVPRPRRVVMLCDVSRSMQPTTTAYLHLMRAAAVHTPTEVFAFGTRLTRLTAVLAHRSAERAVELATARVTDRFGGTRIATAVTEVLASHHGSAVRGGIVVIASDGWDSEPPEELARAMARLRRRAHRVVWLNPRAGAPGFAPLVGTMAAALPFCDTLLPADDVRSMAAVVAELCRSDRGRSAARAG
jgi:uncharacterized protein